MTAAHAANAQTGERSRIADQIFDDLREKIVSGGLARGSKLPTEKELAEHYGVSGPTVREAIRALSLLGMIEVRHGSGAYVSPDGESLVAMSLGAVIQLDGVGASDALDLLSVLNEYAAARAVEQATPADLRRLRDATQTLEDVQSERQAIAGVRAFHRALVQAAHHRLLEVICSFLTDVQIEVAREAAEGDLGNWHRILASLGDVRSRFVTAIERRDAKAARKLAQEFHACAIASITTLPRAEQVQLADPQLGNLLSSIVTEMTRRP